MNKKQLENQENNEIDLLNPSYDQDFQEKDDYTLSYIFTAGLRYCSEHKHGNHPKMQTVQTPISSTNSFEAYHGTNEQVEGASTQKEFTRLQTLGSSSSNFNNMKGIQNVASKPPKPPTSLGISRFAPANNTGKRKSLTMAERAHPVKDARKGNLDDFNCSMFMGSGRQQALQSNMSTSIQIEHEGNDITKTISLIKSSSSGSVHKNQALLTGSSTFQNPTMREMSTDFAPDKNGNFTNTNLDIFNGEAVINPNIDWIDNVLINDINECYDIDG